MNHTNKLITNHKAAVRPAAQVALSHRPISDIRYPISRAGFSLVEAAVATAVVGVAVLAIGAAQHAMHEQSDYAGRLQTALSLANEIRETTMGLPINDPTSGGQYYGPEPNETPNADPNLDVVYFDDLDDFGGEYGMGLTLSPPINALRQSIPDMQGWSQQVTVESVPADNLSAEGYGYYPGSEMMRFTVRVMYQHPADEQAREVTTLRWVSPGGL